MPRKPKHPCRYNGCPNLVESGQSYCDEHKKVAAKEYEYFHRGYKGSERYGSDWRRIRSQYVSSKNRIGFNKMLDDAKAGKIDLILCKSISRFARNIVDSEMAIRQLKGYGTYVEFEREYINTEDTSCGMMLSILSAVAQDESRSISENIHWANRERVKRGEYNFGKNHVLGYDWQGGKLVPSLMII